MYTIIDKDILSCTLNGTSKFYVEITVDTETDLPTAEESWAAGSLALIADTHEIKILNHAGEWV